MPKDMTETPLFFPTPNGAERLFGVLHQPAASTATCAWVFCHPFAEEKLWAHRVYVAFARELAQRGMPVLRFDYRGYGDSDGDFEAVTLDDQIEDIRTAVKFLGERLPSAASIGLFGLRYGASLAVLAAQGVEQIDRLLLWDPLPKLDEYLQDQLRSNLTTQMVLHGKVVTPRDELIAQIRAGERVNIDGYDLGNPFFDAACAVDLQSAASRFKGQALVVEIARSATSAPKADLQTLAETFTQGHTARVQEVQFWKEIKPYIKRSEGLCRTSLEWLEATHG